MLDPFDLVRRFTSVNYDPAPWVAWILAGFGLVIAISLTYHELRMREVVLKKQVNDKAKIKAVLDVLGKVLEAGGDLFERQVKTEAEYDQWKKDFQGWYEETQVAVRDNISIAEMRFFRTIPGRIATGWSHKFNSEHNDFLGTLKEHLENLKSIIVRFSGGS